MPLARPLPLLLRRPSGCPGLRVPSYSARRRPWLSALQLPAGFQICALRLLSDERTAERLNAAAERISRLRPAWDLGVQRLFLDLRFLLLQQNLAFLLRDIGIGRGDFNRLALSFLFDLIRGVGFRLFDVGVFFQLCLLDFQLVVFDRDLALGIDPRVAGLPVRLSFRHGDFLIRFRFGDCGFLLDLRNVVDAQIVDNAVIIGKILDVEADDIQPHRR